MRLTTRREFSSWYRARASTKWGVLLFWLTLALAPAAVARAPQEKQGTPQEKQASGAPQEKETAGVPQEKQAPRASRRFRRPGETFPPHPGRF